MMNRYIKDGYSVVSVVASCSLMMKKEWPLLLPNDEVNLIYYCMKHCSSTYGFNLIGYFVTIEKYV
jgi:Fe-S oxidoreductase